MKSVFSFLVVFAFGYPSFASSDQPSTRPPKSSRDGFVDCSNRDNDWFRFTYLDVCRKRPAGSLPCGQRVTVLQRHKDLLEIALSDGISRYVRAAAISQRADRFVAFDTDSGVADLGAPECPVVPKTEVSAPKIIYGPDPEYTDQARKRKITGTVGISLTVGVDRLPHDINVENKLGYGLDEKALEAVSHWKFKPALKDGQPVEEQIHVSVTFRLF